MASSFTIQVRAFPTWSDTGECYVVVIFADGSTRAVRCEEGDRVADPADWWKHG